MWMTIDKNDVPRVNVAVANTVAVQFKDAPMDLAGHFRHGVRRLARFEPLLQRHAHARDDYSRRDVKDLGSQTKIAEAAIDVNEARTAVG
jgi:hypothetical protein